MPSLANLRSRKNKAVNFTPSKAYWISGHGSEPNDGRTFTVPPGCIIVVKVTPGELSYGYYDIVKNLDVDKLKDPIRNSNYLIDNFGSIAIFKPGDQCPVFLYYLFTCYPTVPDPGEDRYNRCETFGSGVIDFDKITKKKSGIQPVPEGDLIEYMTNFYDSSVYPTKEQVKDAFGTKTMDNIPKDLKTPAKKLDYLYNFFLERACMIDQETLCRNLKGVFYNFICRYRGQETYNVYNRNIFKNSHSYHALAKGIEAQGNKNKILRLLRNKVGEAETRRKGLLRNYYTSPEYAARMNITPQRTIRFGNYSEFPIYNPLRLGQLQEIIASYDYYKLHKVFKNIDYFKGTYTVDQIINFADMKGETPLSLAVRLGRYELILPLILLGAKTDIMIEGKTLLNLTDDPRMINTLNLCSNKTHDELQELYKKQLQFGMPFLSRSELYFSIRTTFSSSDVQKLLNKLNNIDYYRGNFSINEIVNFTTAEKTPLLLAINNNFKELIFPLIALGAKTDISLLEIPTNQETKDELLKYIGKSPDELKALWYARDRGKTARNFKQPTNWLKQQPVHEEHALDKYTTKDSLLLFIKYGSEENLLSTIDEIMTAKYGKSLAHNSTFVYLNSSDDLINYVNEGKWDEPIGTTPLWLAVKMNKIRLIKPLLKAGANASVVVEGKTLSQIASPAAMAELSKYTGKSPSEINAMDELIKEEAISKLLNYYEIPATQKDALRIKLVSFTIEQINAKLQTFLDKNAALARNLAAKEKKKGILGFFGLGRTQRRSKN